MNKFALGCVILLVVLLFLAVFAALAVGGSYNRLVRLQQTVDQSWAQVQNVYQRRADLIPNLVNTVSGAANFEKSTLTEVTNARASVGRVQLDPNKAPTDAAQLEQFQAAQGQLSNALSRLLVVVERYPELKANQSFLSLQAQLEGQFGGRHAWLCAETILYCPAGRGTAAAGTIQFRHARSGACSDGGALK